MKEKIISHEVAKLAKEKGFFVVCKNFYGRQFPQTSFDNIFDDMNSFGGDFSCHAPTQSLLQKWLREKHDIHVEVSAFTNNARGIEKLMYEVWVSNKENSYTGNLKNAVERLNSKNPSLFLHSTYEDALENGLKSALENIKNLNTNAE